MSKGLLYMSERICWHRLLRGCGRQQVRLSVRVFLFFLNFLRVFVNVCARVTRDRSIIPTLTAITGHALSVCTCVCVYVLCL